MRRKLLLVLLCALFLVTVFVACNSSETESGKKEDLTEWEEEAKDREQEEENEETEKEEIDAGNGIFDKPLEWGQYVTFGTYEQDNVKENGKEEVEWLVLEIGDEEALLISRYCLDAMPLHEEWEGVTWEDCTLRKWLNEVFIEEAFSTKERKCIVETELSNPGNNGFFGNAPETKDAVFLLSMEEAYEYFEDGDVWETETLCVNKGRATEPTAYADIKGQFTGDGDEWYDDMADWWLRSTDGSDGFACRVYSYGSIDEWGEYSYVNSVAGVRPAMWVNIGTNN